MKTLIIRTTDQGRMHLSLLSELHVSLVLVFVLQLVKFYVFTHMIHVQGCEEQLQVNTFFDSANWYEL